MLLSIYFPYNELLVFGHLLGLTLGFGGVVYADTIAAQSLFFNDSKQISRFFFLEFAHKLIYIGLSVLCLTGFAILLLKFDNLASIPHKVWVKFFLVGILFLNSLIISLIIMPKIQKRQTKNQNQPCLLSISTKELLGMSFISSLSTAAWVLAFLFGAFSHFRDLNSAELLQFSFIIWTLIFIASFTLFISIKKILKNKLNQQLNRNNLDHNLDSDEIPLLSNPFA